MERINEYSLEELKLCLRETARLWKRNVNALDASICEDLFLSYKFDTETILFLLQFAHKRGADTLKYLIPLAEVLKKKGIKSRTDAELTLEESYDRYMSILVFINHSKKVPTLAEKEKIDEILLKYNPSEEEIASVGEITRMAKRPSLQYFETVLKNKREQAGRPEVLAVRRKISAEEQTVQRMQTERNNPGTQHFPEEFEQIKQSIKKEAGLSDLAYDTWIRNLSASENADHRLEICIPGEDRRYLHLIETRYRDYIEQACRKNGLSQEILLTLQS